MDREIKWHHVPVEEALTLLESSEEGISNAQASLRLSRYGLNEVKSHKKAGPVEKFFRQFNSPLIYVLLAAALVTFLLKEYADTAVILGVVLANAIIGFVQEGKAEHALESLAKMLVPKTSILREGQRMIISSKELVVGDIVLLEAGDRVPADLRLIYTKNLGVDESALTGESTAVTKTTDPIEDHNIPIADRKNMAFAGTFIDQGVARGLVTDTGNNTQIGKISEMIMETEEIKTPLVITIDRLAKKLAVVILAVATATFVLGTLRGFDQMDIFLASVSLAVAAIPEGLPALITISLAIGIKKMASENAIIRIMPAVETLGSATVICSDKTGTLTRNEMTVTDICTPEGYFKISGTGYDPKGTFTLNDEIIDPEQYPVLMENLKAGSLCNDAYLREEGGIEGDATEGALLVSALKAKKFHLPRIDVIPFDSKFRLMATLHPLDNEKSIIYVKGSPEKIIKLCSDQFDGTLLEEEAHLKAAEEMASKGLRVIATAFKIINKETEELDINDLEKLTFIGLQGMMDPPRDEVKMAIKKCTNAGIHVIMITGDHLLTAYTIAGQLGIHSQGALSGQDIDNMTDEELSEKLQTIAVFARTSPGDKSRIVGLLKQKGEIVAVTGDGINDAPALEKAHIGIAMGKNGTEVAKQASDMVLADDNFASIVNAVEQGRDVYSKIQKVILWTLPTNATEGLMILTAVLLGLKDPPLLPLHILWINTITAIGLGIPITVEPKEEHLLHRKPRAADEPLLLPVIRRRIILVSLIAIIATFSLFYLEIHNNGKSVNSAQTIALNTIVLIEIFYLLNSKSIYENIFDKLLSNRIMLLGIAIVLGLQLLITYNPTMNTLLRTSPLEAVDWLKMILISSSVFFIVEIDKYIAKKT